MLWVKFSHDMLRALFTIRLCVIKCGEKETEKEIVAAL